jgi:hypothetical protein
MTIATAVRQSDPIASLAAGLQAGMAGALWMLAWLGFHAAWQRLSFWTSPNLFATSFYGGAALRPGFSGRTLAGMALYLLLYSSLGALFAFAVRNRLTRLRIALLAIAFAIGWYWLSFRVLWKSAMPLVAMLHQTRSNIAGHLIYGALLGRYPIYLPRAAEAAPQQE